MLSLNWYDPEGCISTTCIDIVSQLPLLVAMLMLFQRFDDRMRGTACIETKVTLHEGEEVHFDVPKDSHAAWQLKGPHTTAATPVRRGTGISKPACSVTTHGHCPEEMKRRQGENTAAPGKGLRDLFFKFSSFWLPASSLRLLFIAVGLGMIPSVNVPSVISLNVENTCFARNSLIDVTRMYPLRN